MPSFSFSYEYDRAGNRSKKINNLTSEVTTYVYDSANQLISMEGPDGITTFDWDAAGNMIAKHAPEGTTTYTWDYENQLTQVAPPVGDPINFAYNAMGQRIQKNGTRFIYDGVQMLQETDLNNQTLRSNTFTNEGYGDLVSENDGTDSSFPTFNGQSSTDAIVNKTATVTDRISYSAFGGEDSHTGLSTTPFRFVGKQSYYHDAETGLYLLGAGGNPHGAGRYYDPTLGRFISRDPIGLAGGDVNLYRYAGNNPVNGIDPSGLVHPAIVVAAGAAAVILLACAQSQKNTAIKKFFGRDDKWMHCWTSCRIAKICGKTISEIAGLLKETGDLAKFGDLSDSIDDLIANQQCIPWESSFGAGAGWICSIYRATCEDCCDEAVP